MKYETTYDITEQESNTTIKSRASLSLVSLCSCLSIVSLPLTMTAADWMAAIFRSGQVDSRLDPAPHDRSVLPVHRKFTTLTTATGKQYNTTHDTLINYNFVKQILLLV